MIIGTALEQYRGYQNAKIYNFQTPKKLYYIGTKVHCYKKNLLPKFTNECRVFAPGKLFKQSLLFVGKALEWST
jgi:hypothetical protein